jgi:hypothetical protein
MFLGILGGWIAGFTVGSHLALNSLVERKWSLSLFTSLCFYKKR